MFYTSPFQGAHSQSLKAPSLPREVSFPSLLPLCWFVRGATDLGADTNESKPPFSRQGNGGVGLRKGKGKKSKAGQDTPQESRGADSSFSPWDPPPPCEHPTAPCELCPGKDTSHPQPQTPCRARVHSRVQFQMVANPLLGTHQAPHCRGRVPAPSTVSKTPRCAEARPGQDGVRGETEARPRTPAALPA